MATAVASADQQAKALSLAKVVADAQEKTKKYLGRIEAAVDDSARQCIAESRLDQQLVGHSKRTVGKVRDTYICDDAIVLVTTDRQSAFDRQLARVPFKGAVLNQTSAWWFEKTRHIAPNHLLGSPHPNVCVGKKCKVFPIEFVMRGYLTGSTSTSIWKNYEKGTRAYCGHTLPEGMSKNQALPMGNILTPTTKDDLHDELISAQEIVSSNRMSQQDWDECSRLAHALFRFGQEAAAERGLILVDTKYELGKDADGNIILVDEIHTPDSSRYWVKETYEGNISQGREPENIDKEFLRRWYTQHCDPYKDETVPDAPRELVAELSRRYVMLYEIITGQDFVFPSEDGPPVDERMSSSVSNFLKSHREA
ncbi:conserved unknown protein [Ectocarpus siliculosus]|uniref:phosphoribosylaminoimidazolesuccinocarboxamide synthase n=1 Tax=Ectocarpus siliculosus TaxID=2880 RepID=D7G980_ECTSI|nr:conserved unknown protein [Ectocarpus siliculosus]|eukprot:CBJ28207.1 conserved unknown protein [Ectocarpus siliculosus]